MPIRCRLSSWNPPTTGFNPPACARSQLGRRPHVSDSIGLALLILGLPLVAAILSSVISKTSLRPTAHWPLIVACSTAAILAIVLLTKLVDSSDARFLSQPVMWFAAGKLKVNFTINVDPLSAIMLAMITFVSTWIAIFSSGYMKGDGGYARFFA